MANKKYQPTKSYETIGYSSTPSSVFQVITTTPQTDPGKEVVGGEKEEDPSNDETAVALAWMYPGCHHHHLLVHLLRCRHCATVTKRLSSHNLIR